MKVKWKIVNIQGAHPGFNLEGGGHTSGEGVPTYDFVKISEKVHEIEKKIGL